MSFRFGIGALLATVVAVPAWSSPLDELQDAFQRGVDLLRKGDEAGALQAFQDALALDPSHEAAYELWKSTDHQVWLDLLARSGDFELVSKRLMTLASLGRKARTSDAGAVRALLLEIANGDAIARRRAIRTLAADHGEYAVPHMLPTLADPVAGDRRVLFMNALTEMGDDVVLPLIAALDSPDPFLRRNVALTLGYIGDRRAAGALARATARDGDETARKAAGEALERCGGAVDPVAYFLETGYAYHVGHPLVLGPSRYSGVTWSFGSDGLAATPVPRALYADEMARQQFDAALGLAPDDPRAYAGMALALASELSIVGDWARAGQDVGPLLAQAEEAALELDALGATSLDQAMMLAVEHSDEGAAIALARALGRSAAAPSGALRAALGSSSGALRSESAIALARIALRARSTADEAVVAALGEAAGREVLRVAALVDSDAARAEAAIAALSQRGYSVAHWDGGALALAGLRRLPGVDAVILADTLRDLLPIQVLEALREDARTQGVPVVLLAGDAEAAQGAWADKVGAILAPGGDWSALDALVEAGANADRDEAQRLAVDAASLLSALAATGTDVRVALGSLSSAIGRSDDIAAPAALALGHVGGPEHVEGLIAIANDGSRSPVVRVAAAEAVAELTARHAQGVGHALAALVALASAKDASMELRSAAARTVGRMDLPADARAAAMRELRVNLRAPE